MNSSSPGDVSCDSSVLSFSNSKTPTYVVPIPEICVSPCLCVVFIAANDMSSWKDFLLFSVVQNRGSVAWYSINAP